MSRTGLIGVSSSSRDGGDRHPVAAQQLAHRRAGPDLGDRAVLGLAQHGGGATPAPPGGPRPGGARGGRRGARSAGGTRCRAPRPRCPRRRGLHRGGEAPVAERHRDVVVLALEAERARHPAAAGVHLADLVARPASTATVGAVPTIAFWWQWPWSSARRAPGFHASVEAARALAQEELLEEEARARHRARGVGAEQIDVLVAQGQQAGGLQPDDRAPSRDAAGPGAPRSTRRAPARSASMPLEIIGRPQHFRSTSSTR